MIDPKVVERYDSIIEYESVSLRYWYDVYFSDSKPVNGILYDTFQRKHFVEDVLRYVEIYQAKITYWRKEKARYLEVNKPFKELFPTSFGRPKPTEEQEALYQQKIIHVKPNNHPKLREH